MKWYIRGMLCVAALLMLACGAMAETVYLTGMGIPAEEAEIKVVTIGNLTKGERLIEPAELEPIEGAEGLYALALTEEESAAYKSIRYGRFFYRGVDRTQDLYAVRIQTQGIEPGSIGRLDADSTTFSFPEDAPNAGDIDYYVACPESFVFAMIGAFETNAAYSGRQVSNQQVDLSGMAIGETLTIRQDEVINGFKSFTLQVTKVALLQEAVPSYAETLTDGPFTLYFMDIGLDPANIRFTTTGSRGEVGQLDFHTRTLAQDEYTVEHNAPEGVIAVTFNPQTFEMDGYTYGHISLTMEEDVDAPTMQSTANRAQALTEGLYLYSARFSGVKAEELNRLVVRMRSMDNPSKYINLGDITPEGVASTLSDGMLDTLYFVSGDIVQLYLGRYNGEGATYVSSWEIAENLAPKDMSVGDSFDTFIVMSANDATTHDDIMITITKEAVLREAD